MTAPAEEVIEWVALLEELETLDRDACEAFIARLRLELQAARDLVK